MEVYMYGGQSSLCEKPISLELWIFSSCSGSCLLLFPSVGSFVRVCIWNRTLIDHVIALGDAHHRSRLTALSLAGSERAGMLNP